MKITTTTNLLITLGLVCAVLPIIGLIGSGCLLTAAFICAIIATSQGHPGAVWSLIASIIAGPIALVLNIGITAWSFGAGAGM